MSTINLLPANYVRQRMQRRVNSVCLALFVVVVSSVICAHLVTDRSKRHTLEVRDRVDAEYAEATKLIQRMQRLEAQKAMMLHKAELTASLVERVPRSTLLAIIANARPTSTSLLNVELTSRRIEKKEPTVRPSATGNSVLSVVSRAQALQGSRVLVELVVTGLAATDAEVAKFIANLARNRLIETVDLAYSQERLVGKARTKVREFQISLKLKDGADAIDIAKEISAKASRSAQEKDQIRRPESS